MNTPIPICKCFLTCRQVTADAKYQETCILGLSSHYEHHRFPASTTVGIFARLASAHGRYDVEIQVQALDGNVVWREGPPEPWDMDDPLFTYDLKLNINLVFPAPGTYELVLLVNGQELARERFLARLRQPAGSQR
jgi:hypothetical protein